MRAPHVGLRHRDAEDVVAQCRLDSAAARQVGGDAGDPIGGDTAEMQDRCSESGAKVQRALRERFFGAAGASRRSGERGERDHADAPLRLKPRRAAGAELGFGDADADRIVRVGLDHAPELNLYATGLS